MFAENLSYSLTFSCFFCVVVIFDVLLFKLGALLLHPDSFIINSFHFLAQSSFLFLLFFHIISQFLLILNLLILKLFDVVLFGISSLLAFIVFILLKFILILVELTHSSLFSELLLELHLNFDFFILLRSFWN